MKPRRTTLSVPGHIEKMHIKASQSKADVVMLDLEDSVPMEAKELARETVIRSMFSLDWQGKTIIFRINGLDTPFGYRDLLEVVEAAGSQIDAVVVPKVDHPGDVHFVCRMLDGIEMQKGFSGRIGIEAIIESAQGLEQVSATARTSEPRRRISSFKRPTALAMTLERRELLHTSSANSGIRWAGE